MGEATKPKPCECAGHCKPLCALMLVLLGLIVLGGKISRRRGRGEQK